MLLGYLLGDILVNFYAFSHIVKLQLMELHRLMKKLLCGTPGDGVSVFNLA